MLFILNATVHKDIEHAATELPSSSKNGRHFRTLCGFDVLHDEKGGAVYPLPDNKTVDCLNCKKQLEKRHVAKVH